MGSSHYTQRLEAEWERLDRQDGDQVFSEDADAIRQLLEHEKAVDKAASTREQYLVRLRVLSKRADRPIVEMDTAELQELLNAMATGDHSDVKDSGIKTKPHKDALGRLAAVCDLPIEPRELEVGEYRGRDLSADDLLFQEDVDSLLHACGMDSRFQALIAWGLASGQRIDAIRTVRLGDISFDGAAGQIQLNTDDGALKGSSGSIPLLWAKHYVRQWLNMHPYPQQDGAALFCPDPRLRGTSYSEFRPEPLTQSTIYDRLQTLGERAGIEKNLYPHLLRHSAITRMVLEGLNELQIKNLIGVGGAWDQWDTYVTLADELRNDSVRQDLGVPTSDSGVPTVGKPTLEKCGRERCGEEWPGYLSTECPTCGGTAEGIPLEELADELRKMGPQERDELAGLL